MFTGSIKRSFTFQSRSEAYAVLSSDLQWAEYCGRFLLFRRLTATERELGRLTSATSCICLCIIYIYSWITPIASNIGWIYDWASTALLLFLVFHVPPPNLTKNNLRKVAFGWSPVWLPFLIARGIQIHKPKHRLRLKSAQDLYHLHSYQNTVGSPHWSTCRFWHHTQRRHAFNNIIDQANEIRGGGEQMCLSEGCDGRALCKARLDCNHPLHREFLQLTSAICSLLLKKILQRRHLNTWTEGVCRISQHWPFFICCPLCPLLYFWLGVWSDDKDWASYYKLLDVPGLC